MALEPNYQKKEAATVLEKIMELIKFAPDGDLLLYRIENFFSADGHQKSLEQIKEDEVLHDLQRWGALKIENREHIDGVMHYYLKVLRKFDRVYEDHISKKKAAKEIPLNNESRIDVFIDEDNGIYRFNDKGEKLSYPIKTKSGRWEMLAMLMTHNKIGTKQLLTVYDSVQHISAAVKRINQLFQKRLEVDYPIIVHIITGGYKLNADYFNIDFKNTRKY